MTPNDERQASIESGYFVLTMMPSLYCHLRCPHCYLSLAERQDRTMLSPDLVEMAARKVHDYWERRQVGRRTVVCYWYGGEPTSMGVPAFLDLLRRINGVFDPARGYDVRHTILTSLVSVKDEWFDVFSGHCGGAFQTSYDGDMRGASYVRKWERRVREAVVRGLDVTTISVVNSEILSQGAAATLDYLSDLGVKETSWLPFMWNEQNADGSYGRYAPTMAAWSAFMEEITVRWLERKRLGLHAPEIGQARYILSDARGGGIGNVAGQTLFLMPNGDFVLPDYREGWKEFMRPFGNIVRQDFADVLASPARRAYLRRQATRNGNPECLGCDHRDRCVMEFWKENRPGDDCFGGSRYVSWLADREAEVRAAFGRGSTETLY